MRESMSLDLPDRGLKLMDAGFDVLDGSGYLLLQGTGVGAYVMEVSTCVPVDEGAIALAGVDGDRDGVLLAIDEESITHRCSSFGNRVLGARGNITLFSWGWPEAVRALLECPLMRWDRMNGAPGVWMGLV